MESTCVWPDESCAKKPYVRGLCRYHYGRARYAGCLATHALPAKPRRGSRRAEPGGRYVNSTGYVMLSMGPDVAAQPEHRVIMERMLGRRLVKGENVHHINGVRDDNREENLELWASPQPYGQRVPDLIEYIATYHAEAMRARLG